MNVATGNISTIVGTGTAGFSGDGAAATGAQLNSPSNLLVDENENLYIADTQNGAIRKVSLTAAPTLTFAPTGIGGVSAPLNVSVMNLGNAALNITGINASAGYSLTGPDNTCKASSQNLDAAGSCVLGIQFAPKSGGAIAGTVVLSDNAPSGSQTIVLNGNAMSSASYTLTSKSPTVTITPGTNGVATLTLTSNAYSGTVSFTTNVTSTDGTPANVTASASPVTLAAGATASSTVTISANAQAGNRSVPSPWNSKSAPLFGVVLMGLPFAFRRKFKQAMPLMILIFAMSVAGFLTACAGTTGSGNGSARTYVVTVTPTASPMGSVSVSNPGPATISVAVQ